MEMEILNINLKVCVSYSRALIVAIKGQYNQLSGIVMFVCLLLFWMSGCCRCLSVWVKSLCLEGFCLFKQANELFFADQDV